MLQWDSMPSLQCYLTWITCHRPTRYPYWSYYTDNRATKFVTWFSLNTKQVATTTVFVGLCCDPVGGLNQPPPMQILYYRIWAVLRAENYLLSCTKYRFFLHFLLLGSGCPMLTFCSDNSPITDCLFMVGRY